MNVRLINPNEYPRAARVWEICFSEDAGAFVSYYFSRRTRPEYILAAFDGGEMIGTVHMLPQTAALFGEKKRIGFVAGVATLLEHRHKGVCSAMMNASFDIMKQRGFCATVLQPFDVPFYEQYGYRTFVRRREYRYAAGELCAPQTALHTPSASEVEELYTRFASHYNGMAVRTGADFDALLAERDGGAVWQAVPGAYAMYYEGDDGLNILELAGDTAAMLALASSLNRSAAVTLRLPCDTDFPGVYCEKPFNMLRPLDKTELMRGLPCGYDTLLEGGARINYSFESY